jgi:hypothetical protein
MAREKLELGDLEQFIGNICLLTSDTQQPLATVLRFPVHDSRPFVERDGHVFVRNLLACEVSPPVLPEVCLDIRCSITYMVPRWQVKRISQLFQRPSFRLRHKQVHEEEGEYVQARKNAECARVADTVEEKREDENEHPAPSKFTLSPSPQTPTFHFHPPRAHHSLLDRPDSVMSIT